MPRWIDNPTLHVEFVSVRKQEALPVFAYVLFTQTGLTSRLSGQVSSIMQLDACIELRLTHRRMPIESCCVFKWAGILWQNVYRKSHAKPQRDSLASPRGGHNL